MVHRDNYYSSILQRYSISILFLFFIITYLLYHHTHEIVLTDDAFQFFVEYEREGWGGFYQNYGFTSLYYFTHSLNIFFYTLFGKNTLYWSLLLISLHSFVSYLLFTFIKNFLLKHQFPQAIWIALVSSLLFLISPSHTENVCWVATLHYAISMIFFLTIGNFLILSKHKLSAISIYFIWGLYVLSLLSMEMSLVFPFCWFLFNEDFNIDFKSVKNKKLWLGFLVLIILYFISTRLIKGHFIPHYRTGHLNNHSLWQYLSNYTNYTFKYIFIAHHFVPFSHYYEFIKTPIFLFSFWGIIFLFCLRFYLKTPHLFKPFFTLCVVSFFLLMPVINMYFMIIHLNENNRLGYFFSSMIFPILVIALFRLNKFIYIPILILFIVFNLFYTTKQAKDARIAGHIFTHCIKTFPAITNKKTYLINLPNNYKGYYLFRSLWRIESALFFFNHKKYNFIEIASINMLHETDTIYYQFEGDTILYMNHQIPSVYFMKDAFGAYSRKEPTFTLETEPWLMQCHIHFTPPRQSSDEFILFKKDSFYLVP